MGAALDEQGETIAFLSDASSYGLCEAVERIETHAAIVFLAGNRAYKLKRAVRYPYLDYSSVELRRRACQAELRLNRRTAADLYLDVSAVRRTCDGSLALGSSGEPLDWVVVMRRFDQEALLDRIADRGCLTPEMLRTLTDQIVEFHSRAEVTPSYGGAEGIRSVIAGNLMSMLDVSDIDPRRARALHDRSLSVCQELSPLLDRRRASGHVRRCHGDMHLRNICLLDGRPSLFDCVEFDEAMACIDVLYDLAFLLMDLWHRRLPAEASTVFNHYLDLSEEADGLAAIPLFLSLRAAVRAHVEGAAAALTTDAQERARKRELAPSYLALAEAAIGPRRPRLVAIGGLSGTGKSTLAQAIAGLLAPAPGARVLRSDVARKRLHGVALETRLPASAYTKATSKSVYERLFGERKRSVPGLPS